MEAAGHRDYSTSTATDIPPSVRNNASGLTAPPMLRSFQINLLRMRANVPNARTVLVVTQNIVFIPRIQAAAQAIGYDVRLARSVEAFQEALERLDPALVLIDLEGDVETWTRVLECVAKPARSDLRLVAFGPHEDVTVMDRARNLGCGLVLTKGEFSRDLHNLIAGSVS